MANTRRKIKSNQLKIYNTLTPEGVVTPMGYDEEGKVVDYDMSPILDAIRESPEYIPPTASIPNHSQTREVGETIPSLQFNISFTQNDAGAATGYLLSRSDNNGTWINVSNQQNNEVEDIEVILGTIRYRGTVNYSEGLTKNNNLGEPDPTGKISAGSVNSNISTITGRYKYFFGPTGTIPQNSSDVRSLPQEEFNNLNSIDLFTGTSSTIFVVAIPSTQSITQVNDITNLGADLTQQYVLTSSTFSVDDAGGEPVEYKLYVYQTAIPYTQSATHRILIS